MTGSLPLDPILTGSGEMAAGTSTSRFLGADQRSDLAAVVALVVAYAVLERGTRAMAVIGVADLRRFSLVAAAVANRRWLVAAATMSAVAAIALRPGRMLTAWSGLEHGRALRWLAGSLIVVLAWSSALYQYNWVADRTHGFDRALVVALAVAAIARPAFLVPFVIVVRVVNEQFLFPFGTTAARNVDDLLLMVLLVIAAAHLLFVVTGRNRTAAVVLVISAALAAHFFMPGKGKLSIGWVSASDLANLPLSSYTAGWLGHTGGRWAEVLAGFYERFRLPVMAGTLLLEVGAIVAVVHPHLTRLWLPGLVAFHVMTFATTGFWFVPWIALEVGLLAILSMPSLRSWVMENATPARGLLAVACVASASFLFHPPGLAWLDAPLSSGYEIDAIGVSGAEYHVPASAFAPLSHHIAFDRLQFGPTVAATGAYGAVTTTAHLEALEQITDVDELKAFEATLGPPTGIAPSRQFLMTFLEYTGRHHSMNWFGLSAPEHFWTSRPEPNYRFQEPLRELAVFRVRAIHHDGEPVRERELVLTLTMDD